MGWIEAMDGESFGDFLRNLRQTRGLTQRELERAVGCTDGQISKYERGERAPRPDMTEDLADALEIGDAERETLRRLVRLARARARRPPASSAGPQSGRDEQPPSGYLPTPLTPLIGRDDDLRTIASLMRDKSIRLVTLIGPPGVGKTRLARAVADRVRRDFSGRVRFVPLAAVPDASLVPGEVARALSFEASPSSAELLARLADKLGTRRHLLIVDNVEHVLAAADFLVDLLGRAPRLQVLVTSRESLRCYGEHVVPVRPLRLPDATRFPSLDDLAKVPAVALFVQRARAADPSFALASSNARAIVDLVRRLDGLPLAIELAAARVTVLAPAEILAGLGERLDLLASGPRDRRDQPQSLPGAIQWSYGFLAPREQRLFRCLAVFEDGATVEAISAVCGESEASPPSSATPIEGEADPPSRSATPAEGEADPPSRRPDPGVVDALDTLVRKSLLVRQEGSDSPTRFAMLQTIRAFALERLDEAADHRIVRDRHARYYLTFAERAAPSNGSAPNDWLARVDAEWPNLRSALQHAIGRAWPDVALRLAAALAPYWRTRGQLARGRAWLARALAVPGEDQSIARARALAAAGTLAFAQGDFAESARFLTQALDLFRSLGERAGAAASLTQLGNVAHARGDYDGAARAYEEARALQQDLGDAVGLAQTLGFLGDLHQYRGRYADAAGAYQASLILRRQQDDRPGVADALIDLTWLRTLQGKYAEARVYLAEAQGLARELDYARCRAIGSTLEGWIGFGEQRHDSAERALGAALRRARKLGDRAMEGLILALQGAIAFAQDDHPQAKTLLDASLAVRAALGYPPGVAHTRCFQGWAAFVRGDHAAAEGFFRESLTIYRDLGDALFTSAGLDGQAALASHRGQSRRAARLFGAAAALRDRLDARLPPAFDAILAPLIARVREELGEPGFERMASAGRELSWDAMIREGLEPTDGSSTEGT